ncbi:MAG: hypothetical protein EDX89_00855 [Acidobacteria bacterium]|nr:MAG: hypothetical protein EDX89_00855 [Acidobacteriota bacterium]
MRTAAPREGEGGAPPPFALVLVVLGAVSASRFLAIAAGPGEQDEAVFAGAVTRFDLFDLSPQAPGFPVWILLGRLLLPVFVQPFTSLAAASTILCALGLPALWLWGRRLVGPWEALGATALAAVLPVVWVNGGRAFSDSPATALFLLSLAALSASGEGAPGRSSRALAALAGLLAAAGAGVRPHLVLVFGPLMLVEAVRLARAGRRDAAAALVLSGIAGTLAWGAFLLAHSGGLSGLLASVGERAGFRAHAMATGSLGTLVDSFPVRAFLSPRRAALVHLLALVGLLALLRRRRRGGLDLLLLLLPAFYSLWTLHSRATVRYAIPWVLFVLLAAAAGLSAVLRRPPLAFCAFLLAAFVSAREAWPVVRESATLPPPPARAVDAVARYAHPGRETIVADDILHAFLRTERWEGRLAAWGYLDSELVAGPCPANRRYVRLVDVTDEADPVTRRDEGWRVFWQGGRIQEALANRRLLLIGLRDPAPPLFSTGFSVRETARGRPSFRWAGPAARLVVPGLEGPPVALLSGERPGDAGPTTLTVREERSGRLLLERRVPPGRFELALADSLVYGPLERPRELVLSCDRPVPLPRVPGSTRPSTGCFVLDEATFSLPPERLWERFGDERRVDVGSPADRNADPWGFHDREELPSVSAEVRWTAGDASLLWVPERGFVPRQLAVRARVPGNAPVELTLLVAGSRAGSVAVPPGDFTEVRLDLPPLAVEALTGVDPVRIGLASATSCPRRDGTGDDPRELGVAVDRVILR